ncbi:hypothetical protein Enr8_07870 [Blastopirellula retiformator]|uniref:Uncharacterized protein n=1 Tax=Blastopirellula retiformator TaxID=2527970 RepID=A0A5C5VN01_9BACT|nr:hypothetical protein Enr8_07870 [Blastopirellula retiformator]
MRDMANINLHHAWRFGRFPILDLGGVAPGATRHATNLQASAVRSGITGDAKDQLKQVGTFQVTARHPRHLAENLTDLFVDRIGKSF